MMKMCKERIVKLRIEHCDQPLSDDALLRLAGDLLEDEEADRVNEHLRICWSCGLRAQKARAWLAERKAQVCPRARDLFENYRQGVLQENLRAWFEAHRLVCIDCWEAYNTFVEGRDREIVGLVLGKLEAFFRLLPAPTMQPGDLAYAAAFAARSEAQAPYQVQEFEDPEHNVKAYATLDERDHLVVQVLHEEKPAAAFLVELIETIGTDSCVRYLALTDEAGIADFGPLANLTAPASHPYMLRVSAGEHGARKTAE